MSHVPNYPNHTPRELIAWWNDITDELNREYNRYAGFDYWSDEEYEFFHRTFEEGESTINRIEADLFAAGFSLQGWTWIGGDS